MKKEKTNELLEKDYFNDLNKIKETIRQNQNKAMVYVNSQMIITYYQIGTIINKRKTWGSKYIKRLSNDLKEYGRGYSRANLYEMMRFANEFKPNEISPQLGGQIPQNEITEIIQQPARQILQNGLTEIMPQPGAQIPKEAINEFRSQPVAQIPWRTLIEIMYKSQSHEEMLYYINETHKNGWSRSMVLNQIAMKSYERSLINPDTTSIVKSEDLSNELFKDTYVFDFLDKEKIKTEKDLKNQLIDNIIRFLSELGPGFSLVGKEYRLVTPTNEEFYIDLLMYHTKIHAYVVIEVKIGKFKPEHLGQLIFYVNAIDDLERTTGDDETIGLLLCKDSDTYVAKTSLNKNQMKLGISKYKIIEELPEYLEKRLKERKKD